MLFFPAAWLLPRPYKSIKKCDAFFFLVHVVLAMTTLQYIPLGITHYNLRWLLPIKLIIKTLPPPPKTKLLQLRRLSPSVPFLRVVREGLFHLDPPKNTQEQHLVI